MSMNALKIKLTIVFCLGLSSAMLSQSYDGWEVGGWVGVGYYLGDLNTSYDLSKPNPAAGVNVRYNYNERIATKLFLNFGKIQADDADSPNKVERDRNLSFNSSIIELGGQLEFNFLPYVHGSRGQYYTPYLLAGFNVFKFNPKANLNGQSYKLRDYGTEGQPIGEEYSTVSGAIILGAGYKWDISEEWSINIELGTRRVFTDYLDDVSTTYPSQIGISAQRGNIAASLADRSNIEGFGDSGRQRGNSRDNDNYNFFSIGFMRYFGKLECPSISKK